MRFHVAALVFRRYCCVRLDSPIGPIVGVARKFFGDQSPTYSFEPNDYGRSIGLEALYGVKSILDLKTQIAKQGGAHASDTQQGDNGDGG